MVRRDDGIRPDADGGAAATVSVIVPVWNMEPFLRQCLDSVVGQTIGLDRLGVIAVDDGSTDGSADVLESYASRYPQVVVVREPHSGGPGRPRNLGLDRASGEFVFFLDADDYLGAEALERMVDMAVRNDSDVVLGRMIGFDGRRVPTHAFRRSRDRARVEDVISSLSVLKLFRRSLIERLGLRFEEGLPAHEDGLFTTIAYLEAEGISVLADYDCYYVRQGNRRSLLVDPLDYVEVIARRIDAVESRRPQGAERDRLMRRHIADVLRAFSARWARLEPGRRRRVFERGAQIIARTRASTRNLDTSPLQALRLYCLAHGRQSALEDIVLTPAIVATRDLIVEGSRSYARYPHFRNDAGIPDRCFEIGRRRSAGARLALELGWIPDVGGRRDRLIAKLRPRSK